MSSFWEFYFRPMCVVVLSVAQVGPPTCDIGDSELEVSELHCLPWKGSIHINDLQHGESGAVVSSLNVLVVSYTWGGTLRLQAQLCR